MTKEEWEKAHEVIREIRGRNLAHPRKIVLRKKLRCGHCRRALQFTSDEPNYKCYCRAGLGQPKHSGCCGDMYFLGDIESVVYLAIRKQLDLLMKIKGQFTEREQNMGAEYRGII